MRKKIKVNKFQLLTSLICLGSGFTLMASVGQSWRVAPRGVREGENLLASGFVEHRYGLFGVETSKYRLWADIAQLTCDRWSKVEVARGLVKEGDCGEDDLLVDNLGRKNAEECNQAFIRHLSDRCDVYRDISLASYVTSTCLFVEMGLVWTASAMLLVKATSKWWFLIGPLLLGTGAFSMSAILFYFFQSRNGFVKLSMTGSYPTPHTSSGFMTAVVGVGLNFMAALLCVLEYIRTNGFKYKTTVDEDEDEEEYDEELEEEEEEEERSS